MAVSGVLGCGGYLPPRVVTNEALAPALGTTAASLSERTGISRRHWVDPGVAPSDLAVEASRSALGAAGLGVDDVDLIVFATMTPDIAFPGSGCFLQDKLGCGTVGALDLRAQCAGFVFALATADRFVRAGAARRVLVACAEVHSTALDPTPRGIGATPYFGDGAGAIIVAEAPAPGVLATVLHSDPDGLERFWCEYPASRHWPARLEPEHVAAGRHLYALDAPAVHSQAEEALAAVLVETMERGGLDPGGVALGLVHYLDPRVARRAADRAGLAVERVVATAGEFAHVAAGGIPIALADAVARGRVGRGDVVLCAAFGAGMSWGGAALRL